MNPLRYKKILELLKRRQTDLTLCLDQVHKPNNVSAIIRSADATGVHNIHAVWPNKKMKMLSHTSAGARNWVYVDVHNSVDDACEIFRNKSMQILVTDLNEKSVDFREVDYTKPTAIVLGGEKFGTSQTAKDNACQPITIPMLGMVESLNVSVAAALILFEAQRQRSIKNFHDRNPYPLSEDEIQKILFEKGYPILAKVVKRKALPYPHINSDGQICASDSWWSLVRQHP